MQCFKFFIMLVFPFHLMDFTTARNNAQVDATVSGDQTVGGIHLFELHAPGGGVGLGIKIMLILAIAAAVGYWWLKRRAKKALQRTLQQGIPLQSIASPLPTPLQQLAPPAPVHASCRHNRPRPRRASATDADSSAFRL